MLTRRAFLKSGACALATMGSVPRFLVRAAYATGSRRKLLWPICSTAPAAGPSRR